MSILEHSHRGKEYEGVHNEAIALLTELLGVPSTHQILFLQGGASMQFAMVPMNFLPGNGAADYIVNGAWAEKALEEAKIVGKAKAAGTSRDADKIYRRNPKASELQLDPNASYVHVTSNETIFGVQYQSFPDTGKVPLVADMSSDFLWRKFDVSKFGLIYAGAQKNIGPSGVAVVIVNKEWMGKARTDIPKILRYSTHAENNSLYNTPPTFAVYLVRNVLSWMKESGGLSELERRNKEKAETLYGALDRMADFYKAPVERDARSVMNIVFRLPSEEKEEAFVKEAKKAGMVGLKGHRSAGGIRVSAYNAVTPENIKTLVAFMEKFAAANK